MDTTQAFENIREVCFAYIGTYVEHCQIKTHLEAVNKRVADVLKNGDDASNKTICENFTAITRIVTACRANSATHDQLALSLQTVAEHVLADQEFQQMFGIERPKPAAKPTETDEPA